MGAANAPYGLFGEDAVRVLATLVIIVLAGLPALFAGWPAHTPAFFDTVVGGVPGSIAAMSLLLLAFVVIAAICGVIARGADKGEAGQ
jgi:hypothetical protein